MPLLKFNVAAVLRLLAPRLLPLSISSISLHLFSFVAEISGWSSRFLVSGYQPRAAIASLFNSTLANDFFHASLTIFTIS
jgi:hypothetical protein